MNSFGLCHLMRPLSKVETGHGSCSHPHAQQYPQHSRPHPHYHHHHHQQRPHPHYHPRPQQQQPQHPQPYYAPPRHNTRSYYHAQLHHPQQHHHVPRSSSPTYNNNRFQPLARLPSRSPSPAYQRQPTPPPVKPRRTTLPTPPTLPTTKPTLSTTTKPTNTSSNGNNNNNAFQGLIISDSMCSRVRTQAVKKFNLVDVELTYESGCDCNNMANWLNTPEGRRVVRQKEFLLISLGTNDVARYGVDEAIQRCGELVCFIRRSCQGIRAIGWLALSPRWKPTRYVSAEEFGELHYQFNERLRLLSKQLDFDVVDACLGPEDMRVEDGLHPSTTTGRWKYEEAIREWFTSHAVARHSSLLQRSRPPTHSNSDDDLRPLMPPRQQRQPTIVDTTNNRPVPSPSSSSPPRPSNNSTQPFSVTTDKTTEQLGHSDSSHQFRPSYPTKALIGNYPHKLRAIEQYYREHQLPQELEKDKNKVFFAANLYYQSRHFQEEAKKWEIYKQVASRDENKANDLEELPLARPSRERHQHILDITLSSDSEPRRYNNDASQSSSSSELDQEEPKKRKTPRY